MIFPRRKAFQAWVSLPGREQLKRHRIMKKEKHVIVIDYNDPLSFYKPGNSQRLTFAERMSVYRLLLFKKGFACPRYQGIRGILRLSVQFFKNESRSLFRRSQQQVMSNDKTSPEFEHWAKTMEGREDRPQCGQGSDATASSSLRSSSSEG